jgi:VWFA-related protein
VFRAGVALVKVDVQVTDRKGRLVRDLAAGDFRVLDEGEPRPIVHFGREAEPLDLLLLLDVSGSMTRSLEQMAGMARAALQPLGPGDRVAVMLFSREAAVRRDFGDDFAAVQAEIRQAVRERELGSGTEMNKAIIAAARHAGAQPPRGRRAILVVTDNISLNYQVPDEEVIRALYAADAVLNAILIGNQKRPDPPRRGAYVNPEFTPSDVFKLAEQTGGEMLEGRRAGESFQQMIERIRARYSLHYEPPAAATGTFRRIQVELTGEARQRHPDAVVRSRAGYYLNPAP